MTRRTRTSQSGQRGTSEYIDRSHHARPDCALVEMPQRALSLASRPGSREGRQPHGDTYKVRQIFSVSPAFCGFFPLLGIKPIWRGRSAMSASDPKPTLRHCSPFQCASLDRHDALSRASGMAMRRREFIALPGDAAAGWSLATRAQPCIGLRFNLYSRLSVGSRDPAPRVFGRASWVDDRALSRLKRD